MSTIHPSASLLNNEIIGIILNKQIIQQLYDDPTILSMVSSPSTFKKEMVHKDTLMQSEYHSVEEAHTQTKILYKLNYPLTPFKQEFSHLLKYIYYTILQSEIPSKKLTNYWTNNIDFFQKSYIRVKLTKCNWNPIKIEELIYRHFPQDASIPSEKQIHVRYLLLKGYLRLPTVITENKCIGRPKCPLEIKEIIQSRINKKLSMSVKKNRDTLLQLKQTFTPVDIDIMIDCLTEHPELIEKCKWLKEICAEKE